MPPNLNINAGIASLYSMLKEHLTTLNGNDASFIRSSHSKVLFKSPNEYDSLLIA